MQANTDDSPPSSPTIIPGLSGTGSTSRLVLLPDTDDPDTDEELGDDSEDSPLQPAVNSLPIPPLPPSVLFLYLLSPYLRLGAIFASDFHDASFANGLVGLVVAAFLSAVCRQIWFLLGRYLRASSTEDIFIHAFARRRRNRVGKNELARHTFTVIRGLFKVLLAAMYLRGPFVLPISILLFLILLSKKIPLTLSYSSKSPCPFHSTLVSMFRFYCLSSCLYSLSPGRWPPSPSCVRLPSL
jgi:hypothetical protein